MSMQSIITNQILKHAAGTAMFCGLCNTSLDFKRCVLIEDPKRGSTVICASCFSALPAETLAILARDAEVTKGMEVN